MKILITLCARGGSRGIPGKNTKILNGIPLIAYSINSARKFAEKQEADIVLSTDADYIREAAAEHGLQTEYRRPDELANSTAGKVDTIKDVLAWMEKKNNCRYDYLIDLDLTSPMRTVNDLLEAFQMLDADANALNLITVSPPARNPYFNMVEKKENGYFAQVVKLDKPVLSRQLAPKVYDMNSSFYIYRRKYFDMDNASTIGEHTMAYVINHMCFDLDEPVDFEIMDFMLKNNKLDFDL